MLNDGISLVDYENKKDVKLPSVSDFHSAFQVVFIDCSGYLNICSNVFKSNYVHVSLNLNLYFCFYIILLLSCNFFFFLQIKNECIFAVEMLDNSNMNSFPCLFLTKANFLQQFDHYIK